MRSTSTRPAGACADEARGELPYNVATPLVVETLEHATSLERWCVMVQREVADRFFAQPRTKAYGAVSRSCSLGAQDRLPPVPPTVFRPRPRVESVSSPRARDHRADRRGQTDRRAAFAHRRKTLANSVALSDRGSRAQVEDALRSIGQATNVRAEELEPADFVRLADALR
jgi:16S rRNA (adenine1518-N6/adenine1519-N6)-dimethyltransferase